MDYSPAAKQQEELRAKVSIAVGGGGGGGLACSSDHESLAGRFMELAARVFFAGWRQLKITPSGEVQCMVSVGEHGHLLYS